MSKFAIKAKTFAKYPDKMNIVFQNLFNKLLQYV